MGFLHTITILQENVSKMRAFMRQQSYLSKPEKNGGLFSLENNELNPKLPKIVELAQRQRQENILNVIRHNDFEHG